MFKWLKNKFSKESIKEIPVDKILEEEEIQQGSDIKIKIPAEKAEQITEKVNADTVENLEKEAANETVYEEQILKEETCGDRIDHGAVDDVFVNEKINDEKYGDFFEKMNSCEKEEVVDSFTMENVDGFESIEDHYEKDFISGEEVSTFDTSMEDLSFTENSTSTDNFEEKEAEERDLQGEEESAPKLSLFGRLKQGLSKTRKEVGIKINTVLGSYVKIEDEMLEDLEDILISADIGMDTTMKLIDNLRQRIIREKINDPSLVKDILKSETKSLMNEKLNSHLNIGSPSIILVVGVNGVGKTTTIGKLAARLKKEGKTVLIAAGDTFRAAAIDQLKEWGNRANVEVISHVEGADPAAVIFDGIAAAKSRNVDVLICDTAGRLHNKTNLMKELEKINRIIDREYSNATRETLLVLDATTGQNAMNQAKTFKESCDLTGIALTKLDGTAKGGVVIALQSELQIPIKLIGVGEKIDDLQDFNIDQFVSAIFDE